MAQSIAQLLGEADRKQKKSAGVKRSRVEDIPSPYTTGVAAMPKGDARAEKRSRSTLQTRRLVRLIPLDAAGRPVYPIDLGDLVVYSLGRIVAQPGYHTEDCIYPVGYCSTRLYLSVNRSPASSLEGSAPTCFYT